MASPTIKDLQTQLREQDKILTIEADLILPRIGGYNSRPYDSFLGMHEPPRATELKALWRWWMRVIYSACECGEKDYEDLDKEVGNILGSTEESSKFSIEIKTKKRSGPVNSKDLEKVPRIKLLTLKRREETQKEYEKRKSEELCIPERVEVSISLYKNRKNGIISENEAKIAVSSFLLSLILGGLGSITSRGFGSIVIKGIEPGKAYNAIVKDMNIIDQAKRILNSSSRENLKENINSFIDYTINLVCEVEKCRDKMTREGYRPCVPTLVPNKWKWFRLEAIECPNLSPAQIIREIGNACLKATWKGLLGRGFQSGNLHTWMLGLPRSSGYTGYIIINKQREREPGRRPSAIRLKYFECGGKKFVLVYGFLSEDWPLTDLYHCSGKYGEREVQKLRVMGPKGIKPFSLEETFNAALEFVVEHLKESCSAQASKRWP